VREERKKEEIKNDSYNPVAFTCYKQELFPEEKECRIVYIWILGGVNGRLISLLYRCIFLELYF
jgi:hypothetical protein